MRIGLLAPEQHDSLIELLRELHAYYNPASAVEYDLVRSHLLVNLLAADSPLRLVVASEADGTVIGFAAISVLHSLVDPRPEQRRQCWLKELFVRGAARNRGVGRSLFAWVARYAVEHDCCRIDWPVQASNQPGIAFYERLGAERVVERLSYRLSGANLARLALAV